MIEWNDYLISILEFLHTVWCSSWDKQIQWDVLRGMQKMLHRKIEPGDSSWSTQILAPPKATPPAEHPNTQQPTSLVQEVAFNQRWLNQSGTLEHCSHGWDAAEPRRQEWCSQPCNVMFCRVWIKSPSSDMPFLFPSQYLGCLAQLIRSAAMKSLNYSSAFGSFL